MTQASTPSTRSSGDSPGRRAPYALLLAFVAVFTFIKVALIGFGRVGELWLSCVFDVSFWALCWLGCELAAEKGPPGAERLSRALFYLLLYVSGGLVFLHSWFYDDAAERRLTLLDISANGYAQFLHEFTRKGYLVAAGLVVGVHALAFALFQRVERPRFSRAAAAVSGLCAVGLASSLLAPRTPPTALFDTSYGVWQFLRVPRVQAAPVAREARSLNKLDKSPVATLPAPHFKKVIVLVMETTTTERFERDLPKIPADSFFRAHEHIHEYTRYFPNNQDSRTGMLAMLTSRVIPYEAYSEANMAAYANVARIETLIDHLRRLGYRSAFALSQVVPEEVVRDMPWDTILHLEEDERPKLEQQKFLCLVPDPWESSCDDRVLIPRIVDFLAASERSFVFQEFIWGHAIEYNQLSGKSNGQFYSGYVDELIAALKQRGLLDDTLIAITSDHGYRGQTVQDQLKELHIPLWFYASRFEERSDPRLLSHVDFKDLLFDELGETHTFTTPNAHVFVQGPTGSGMVTAISGQGVLTLLKERAGAYLLWSRVPSDESDTLEPGQLRYLFEQQRASFDATMQKAN